MKKNKLLSQLNIFHFSLSGIIIFVLLFTIMLLNYWQSAKYSAIETKENFEKTASIISSKLIEIEKIAQNYQLSSFSKEERESNILPNVIDFILIEENGKIALTKEQEAKLDISRIVLANKLSVFNRSDSTTTPCMITKNQRGQTIFIIFKSDWLNEYANYPGVSAQSVFILFDYNAKQINSSNTELQFSNQFINKLSEHIQKVDNDKRETVISYKYPVENGKKPVNIYMQLTDYQGCALALVSSSQGIRPYTSSIALLLLGLGLFVAVSILIAYINNLFTKPLSQITASITQNSKYYATDNHEESDYELISKYISYLENQNSIYEKKFESIKNENKNLENDLKLANRLQKNLLPANSQLLSDRNEFDIYAYTESAFKVGGDLFDCFMIDNDHLLVAVADVAGKGIAASLYMIYTHTTLRAVVKPGLEIKEIIQRLNNQLIEENVSDMFVTIFAGILKLSTGEFEYCNAAHNAPCLITFTGSVNELPEIHGIPLGIYPNRNYLSSKIELNYGDQIFIYTDGLTDTIDENDVKFTLDVLKYNLMGAWFLSPAEVIERVKSSVEYFRGNNAPVDDITIMSLKYTLEKK